MNNLGVIIQARTSSTRMKDKVLLPFYDNNNILSIIVDKFKELGLNVVVATSWNHNDDKIEEFCKANNIQVFRGSEHNVLDRFVSCAHNFGFDKIIRVCSDNPFLDKAEINKLIRYIQCVDHSVDYVSFLIDGVPSIKTHFGFWVEYVTLNALEKIAMHTSDKLYREHVTNFIYTNDHLFKIEWLNPDEVITGKHDIRLTIDTKEDFNSAVCIYDELVKIYGKSFSIENILQVVDKMQNIKEEMQKQIFQNSK